MRAGGFLHTARLPDSGRRAQVIGRPMAESGSGFLETVSKRFRRDPRMPVKAHPPPVTSLDVFSGQEPPCDSCLIVISISGRVMRSIKIGPHRRSICQTKFNES